MTSGDAIGGADGFIPPGRELPHSIDAERAVLGAILIDNDALSMCRGLRAEHFALVEHRETFRLISSLIDNGHLADPITVKNKLNGELADDKIVFIAGLADAAVGKINASQYAAVLRDLAVRRSIIDACAAAESEAYNGDTAANPTDVVAALVERVSDAINGADLTGAVMASSIVAEDIEWLWPGHIPLGMFTLVGGAGSTGKSSMMYDFAARVTTAQPWPDGSACEKGRVALVETEDAPASIIVPRLVAAGADLDDVLILETIRQLPKGPALGAWLRKNRIRMLVISPITKLLEGEQSSNSETDVRASLDHVSAACKSARCAFIGLGHVNKDASKNAVFRVLGSVAYVNASRAVFLVTIDKETGIRTITATEKFNIAEQPGGWNFTVEHVGPLAGSTRLNWTGKSDATADDLLQQKSESGGKASVDAAANYLRTRLADGPVASDELTRDAEACGHSFATLQRAKKLIGGKSYKIVNRWFMKLEDVLP